MKDSLQPGLTITRRVPVDATNTIAFMGEDLAVYSTPSMVLNIEETCKQLLDEHSDDGESSVGAHVDVEHLGATLMGMWVDVAATIVEVDRRRVTFDVEVNDALDLVGRCRHMRFVIDLARQAARLKEKRARLEQADESGGAS